MRQDHFTYQQAARVAGFGLLVQASVGVAALLFGVGAGDALARLASAWILLGVAVWVVLWLLFQQHKLERLEAARTR